MKVQGLIRDSLGRRFALSAGALALVLASLSAGAAFLLAYRDAERDAEQTLAGLIDAVKTAPPSDSAALWSLPISSPWRTQWRYSDQAIRAIAPPPSPL